MKQKNARIRNVDPTFRGWTKPGPMPDLEAMHTVEQEDGESLDALCGHWRIFQLKDGHRFSTDDILTGWYGSAWCPSASRVLDMGSGIGSVGMVAAWRLPHARFVTIEAQEMSVQLARKSARYNGILDRYELRHGDLRDPLILSPDERFELILGSPPYFPLEAGVTAEHPQKVACRFEVRGGVEEYCQRAAAHLSPGGVFACVFPTREPHQAIRPFHAAQAADMVVVRRRPVIFREGEEELISLFIMMRKQDLPPLMHERTWTEPPLMIRDREGHVHPEYDAVKLAMGFPPGG